MKSFSKFFLLLVAFIGGTYLAACAYAKTNTSDLAQAVNSHSILATREAKYVKIDNAHGRDEDGYGNYIYTLTSYNKDGQEQEVRFTGMGKLKQGHYLKLDTKGTYIITYEEAFPKDMPANVTAHLN